MSVASTLGTLSIASVKSRRIYVVRKPHQWSTRHAEDKMAMITWKWRWKKTLVQRMVTECWLQNNLDVLLDPILQPGWMQWYSPGREDQC